MAQTGYTPIQLYHSTTGSAVPLAANLQPGELALNIADMKLYCENAAGVVTLLASATGSSGNVVGPASSTDNAVVRFDGTTGLLIQNSAVTIADTTGDITAGRYNKVTVTAPATSATLTIADGKTATFNNSVTFSGTDGTTMTFPNTTQTLAALGVAQTFTADQTISGNLTLNAQGDVRFADADSSNYAAIQAPATLASNYTLTLPTTDGDAGQFLQTDGSGVLTWASAGAGDVILSANNAFTGANTFYNNTGQTIGTATSSQDGVIIAGRAGGTSSFRVTIQPGALTGSQTLTLPDNTGTILTTGAAVTVAQGGTGLTTLTANNVLLGNGTSSPTFVAPGTNGNVLTSNGTTWISSTPAAQVYPAAGIANSTGTAWGTSYTTTGSGTVVALATSPSFTTPTLGVASATSINKVTLTTPATGSTLTIADGKTLTANNSITLSGTDSTTMTFPSTTTTVVGIDTTQTLTNKRVNPRVVAAAATSGNLTIAGDTTDVYKAEGLTGAITFLQPSGTPVDGQRLVIRLEDNGTARGITWTTTSGAFRAVGITLPTTTVLGKVTYVGCMYNSTDSFWDAIATVTQA